MVTTSQSVMDHGSRRTAQPTQHRYPRIKTCGLLPFALAMIRLGQIVGFILSELRSCQRPGRYQSLPIKHRYDHRARSRVSSPPPGHPFIQ